PATDAFMALGAGFFYSAAGAALPTTTPRFSASLPERRTTRRRQRPRHQRSLARAGPATQLWPAGGMPSAKQKRSVTAAGPGSAVRQANGEGHRPGRWRWRSAGAALVADISDRWSPGRAGCWLENGAVGLAHGWPAGR